MDLKSVSQEIEKLLRDFAPYRAVDLSELRRIIMPRATLSEQNRFVILLMKIIHPHKTFIQNIAYKRMRCQFQDLTPITTTHCAVSFDNDY